MNKFKTVHEEIKKINKLVLSGGGYKGCVYVGMMKYLEEIGINHQIKSIIGTSIGSLFAALIAIGYKSSELEQIMYEFDYHKHENIDIVCLLEKFGIDSFVGIEKFIESLFLKKNFRTDITFEQFFIQTGINLIVTSVCLNTQETVFFEYNMNPQMSVILALKASMALPYLFASVTYKGLTYIDGGVLDNFPIDFFRKKSDSQKFAKHYYDDIDQQILGINLHNSIKKSLKDILTIDQYSIQLFECIYGAYNMQKQLTSNQNQNAHIITISIPKFQTFDFNVNNDDKKFLCDLGYDQTKKYFEICLPSKIINQLNHQKNIKKLIRRSSV